MAKSGHAPETVPALAGCGENRFHGRPRRNPEISLLFTWGFLGGAL